MRLCGSDLEGLGVVGNWGIRARECFMSANASVGIGISEEPHTHRNRNQVKSVMEGFWIYGTCLGHLFSRQCQGTEQVLVQLCFVLLSI